jgi:MATE family multidrug resistance protein
LPLLLALYVRFIAGAECWRPLTTEVFSGWKSMLRLAVPGLVMLEAGFLAWEIQTIISSYLGPTELAAQSALASIVSITFQVCYSNSIASGTHISNLVGAGRTRRAVVATRVSLLFSLALGVINLAILVGFRKNIPSLFTDDMRIRARIGDMLPFCAAMQICDALASACNGILRAVGRPEVAGYVQLVCCYLLVLPLGFWLAFWKDWKLMGIWTGFAVGLVFISGVELMFVLKLDWERAVSEAEERNRLG